MTEPRRPEPRDPDELGFERIVYEKTPPRATITLNRPDVLNAFDFLMLREIARACEDASWDDGIRVVVVTGAGRAFCVGADLKSWSEDYLGKPGEYWKWFGAFKDMHDRLREVGKPTVARINGICVGGGNELQMACDLAVIVDDTYIRHHCRGVGARQSRRSAGRARCRSRSARREPRAQAPPDDALREAASELLARLRLAPDDQPRARLARPLHGDGGAAGGRAPLYGEAMSVLVEREEPIAVARLNRPEQLNALSSELMRELVGALENLDGDDAVRCVVLAGDERAFAAGADIAELRDTSTIDLYFGARLDLWDALRSVRTPLVAAVSGYCLGGGCELAMACDLIVASESAQFGQPETGLGVMPGAGGTQLLARSIGKAKTMDVVLTGRFLDAWEAERAGLVARVVGREAWLDEAKRVARAIAEKGPVAQRLAKEAVNRAFETTLSAGLDVERKLFHLAHSTEDAKEGLIAFGEKRKPEFRGR
jgi:enoyl-CoA hydratase